MNKYRVKVYVATAWSFFTHADHYEEFTFTTGDSLEVFAKRMARDGFRCDGGAKWIMPASILTMERIE